MSIADGTLPITNVAEFFILMSVERLRLGTFQDWPSSFVSKEDLASAGFFYLQNSDRVQCAYCRGVVCNWEEGDDAFDEHKRHYPTCPFVRSISAQRLIDVASEEWLLPISAVRTSKMSMDRLEFKDVGILSNYVLYPQHVTIASRLSTFKQSSKRDAYEDISVEKLADAGFFVTFNGDICCFCCGTQIQNVKSADPWKEHFIQNRNCCYIALNKNGLETFVESDLSEKTNQLSIDDNDDLSDKCKTCMINNLSMAFLPCGHVAVCTKCAHGCEKCCICRSKVKGILRLFFA